VKSLHLVALICFIVAMALYLSPWPRGAYGLAAFGFVFEFAAWVAFYNAERSSVTNGSGTPSLDPTSEPATDVRAPGGDASSP
jgi:hypothetical protein